MAQWLKTSKTVEERAEANKQVRLTVETILADIEKRGDDAVRELSRKFDGWDRPDFRLSQAEIDACMAQLTDQDLSDIAFAQTQVRNFAKAQKATMLELSIETLPGVTLGHKHVPICDRRLLRARRQVSAARLGPYVGADRQGRRLRPGHHLRAALQRQGRAGDRRGAAHGGRRRDLRARRHPGDRRDGHRHGQHQVGRHAGRSGQCLCRRSQAPALRPRRHRPVRRPDRDAGDRRRDGGWRTLRHRPAGPGRARPDLAGDPARPIRRSWRATRWRRSSACSRSCPPARWRARRGRISAR